MIDYKKIADSISFFDKENYKRIEAPWWVSQDISNITKPKEEQANDYFINQNQKSLVASGEQSFLYLANKGRLLEGQYQTTTPCFRNESIGVLHKKCFIKNELIKTDKVTKTELDKMVDIAFQFFLNYFDKSDIEIIETDKNSYDIQTMNLDKNIELGSYGIRDCEFLEWIYGTGCAEPRLTRAIKINEKYKSK